VTLRRAPYPQAVVDRDRIERTDFPTGRRGYDPAAVDEHLRRVADEFDARVHAPPVSLSSGASEQVRLILEAAERSASELRSKAGEEASDHVARVQEAADGMLSKLDALESELERLLSALRTGGERLVQGLAELRTEVAGGDVAPPPAEIEDVVVEAFAVTAEPAADPADEAGARLIALNMALSGSPREDTARYLADHFGLAEPDALLDDVYARAGQ
jgi:DivIVA domain-containing protein